MAAGLGRATRESRFGRGRYAFGLMAMPLFLIGGTAGVSAVWDAPRIVSGDLTSSQIGWSVSGRHAFLWKRDAPWAAPVAIVRQTNHRPKNRANGPQSGRANGLRPRRSPTDRLSSTLRPLASLAIGADCTKSRSMKIVTVTVPLKDPLLLRSGPIGVTFTYHLEQHRGWINAQIRATANEVTATAMPGAAEGSGEMRLWLDPDVALRARGVTAHVLLVLASRRPLFGPASGNGVACGAATFALDTIELNQG